VAGVAGKDLTLEKKAVRIDAPKLNALKKLCDRDGVAMTTVVNMLVEKYLEVNGLIVGKRLRGAATKRCASN